MVSSVSSAAAAAKQPEVRKNQEVNKSAEKSGSKQAAQSKSPTTSAPSSTPSETKRLTASQIPTESLKAYHGLGRMAERVAEAKARKEEAITAADGKTTPEEATAVATEADTLSLTFEELKELLAASNPVINNTNNNNNNSNATISNAGNSTNTNAVQQGGGTQRVGSPGNNYGTGTPATSDGGGSAPTSGGSPEGVPAAGMPGGAPMAEAPLSPAGEKGKSDGLNGTPPSPPDDPAEKLDYLMGYMQGLKQAQVAQEPLVQDVALAGDGKNSPTKLASEGKLSPLPTPAPVEKKAAVA